MKQMNELKKLKIEVEKCFESILQQLNFQINPGTMAIILSYRDKINSNRVRIKELEEIEAEEKRKLQVAKERRAYLGTR